MTTRAETRSRSRSSTFSPRPSRRRPMNDQAESLRRLVRAHRDWERLTASPPTAPRPEADREAAAPRDNPRRPGAAPRAGRGEPRNPR
jgi:hypothetical protein